MDPDKLKQLLQAVAKGQTTVDEAMGVMRDFSSEDIGFAHIDHHRALRKGFPEVIYGQGKTRDQIIAIMERISQKSDVVLATRVDPEKAEAGVPAL